MAIASPMLPYGRHDIDEEDVLAVAAALRSGWLTQGPAVESFEEAFAAAVGARHAVACSSGTAALHLACLAAGLGAGDAAIAPAITFVATANAARFTGAEVVFADVDPSTGLMGPDHLEEAVIRAKARGLWPHAVLPVHFAGQTCDLAGIREVADRHALAVIEDASHAVGAAYGPTVRELEPIGACRWSAMTTFSLHPVKNITMGEGGVVTCRDDGLVRHLRRFRNQGVARDPARFVNGALARDPCGGANPWYHEFNDLGFNYRASDLNCALGSSQLRKLDQFVTRRGALVARYEELLASAAPLICPIARAARCRPAWHLAVVRIDFAAAGMGRGETMRRLAANGIGTQVHYIPVPWQPYYRKRYGDWPLPGAAAYYQRCLSLPLFPAMSDADVDRVVDALLGALRLRQAA